MLIFTFWLLAVCIKLERDFWWQIKELMERTLCLLYLEISEIFGKKILKETGEEHKLRLLVVATFR